MAAFSTQGAEGGASAGAALGPWGALAGGVIGGFLGGGQEDATKKAAAENLQFQQQMYQQQDPFSAGGNRAQYVGKMNDLATGGPSSITNDPTYQAMNEKSMTDMNRSMEASGQGGSGQAALALQQNSQGNMMNYWSSMMSTYGGLSGATGGKTNPMHGLDPSLAGQNAGQTANNYSSAFGMFAGGLQSIFGQPKGGVNIDPNATGYNIGGTQGDGGYYQGQE
jgi:hypothetical protein